MVGALGRVVLGSLGSVALVACGPTLASPEAGTGSTTSNDTTTSEGSGQASGSEASTSGVTPPDLPAADEGSSDGEALWDECPFRDGIGVPAPDSPYPYCQPDGGNAIDFWCAPQPNAHGFSNWHANPDGTSTFCSDDIECNACMCFISCSLGDEPVQCPEPTSGTAESVCFTFGGQTTGSCWLDCTEGQTCPDDMQCVDQLELGLSVCAWTSQGERCERP